MNGSPDQFTITADNRLQRNGRLNESPALRDAYAGSHCCRCFQLDDKSAVPAGRKHKKSLNTFLIFNFVFNI